MASVRSSKLAKCPRSIVIAAYAALNSGAVFSSGNSKSFDEVQEVWIDSRKFNKELRSCPTAEEQFVSAMKTMRHDLASVLSGTHGSEFRLTIGCHQPVVKL